MHGRGEDTLQVSVMAGGDDDGLYVWVPCQFFGSPEPVGYAQFIGNGAGNLGTGVGDRNELSFWDMSSKILGVAPPDGPNPDDADS